MKLKTVVTAASGLALAIALAGPASAGNETTAAQAGTAHATAGMTKMSADKLTKASVVNGADERIGEIEEVVRDKQSNELRAVIGVGGFLGIGEKDVAIPVKSLELTGDNEVTARDGASKEQLKASPSYDKARYEKVPAEQMLDLRTVSTH
jgi:hypothetical protein